MNNETLLAQPIILKHDIYPLLLSPHLTRSPCFWLHSLSLCWGLDYFIFKPLKGSPCISGLSLHPHPWCDYQRNFSWTGLFRVSLWHPNISTAPPWREAVIPGRSLWSEALHRGVSQYLLGSISLLLTCHSSQTGNSPGAFSSQWVCPAHFFWWVVVFSPHSFLFFFFKSKSY